MRRFIALAAVLALMFSAIAPVMAQSTRDNPTPFGKTARVNQNWELTVVSVNRNAYAEMAKVSNSIDAPKDGNQYVLIRFKVTYIGSEVGDPATDFMWRAVGQSNVSYDYGNFCPYMSNPEASAPTDVFPGGTFVYDRCFEVTSADAETLVAYVKIFLEDGLTFFSLDDPEAKATPTVGA